MSNDSNRATAAMPEPTAWMCVGSVEPEFTADALLAGYWMRKGRTVTPLFAAPKLDVEAERLLRAVKVYAFNYMQDEAEDEEDCVCGPKQHAEAKEVFAAIRAFEQARAPSNNSPAGGKDKA